MTTVNVPLLDLKPQYQSIKAEVDAAMARVVESQYFILGPEVEALEQEIAAYCHAKHGIGCTSGSDALILALITLGGLPMWSLVALGALPVALGVFARLDRDQITPDDCWRVYRAGAHAAWLTGLLFCAGLVVDTLL